MAVVKSSGALLSAQLVWGLPLHCMPSNSSGQPRTVIFQHSQTRIVGYTTIQLYSWTCSSVVITYLGRLSSWVWSRLGFWYGLEKKRCGEVDGCCWWGTKRRLEVAIGRVSPWSTTGVPSRAWGTGGGPILLSRLCCTAGCCESGVWCWIICSCTLDLTWSLCLPWLSWLARMSSGVVWAFERDVVGVWADSGGLYAKFLARYLSSNHTSRWAFTDPICCDIGRTFLWFIPRWGTETEVCICIKGREPSFECVDSLVLWLIGRVSRAGVEELWSGLDPVRGRLEGYSYLILFRMSDDNMIDKVKLTGMPVCLFDVYRSDSSHSGIHAHLLSQHCGTLVWVDDSPELMPHLSWGQELMSICWELQF